MRITMNLMKQHEKTIRQAAHLRQLPIDLFARAAVIEKAQDTVNAHFTTTISQRDMERFCQILDAQEKPLKALVKTIKLRKKFRGRR